MSGCWIDAKVIKSSHDAWDAVCGLRETRLMNGADDGIYKDTKGRTEIRMCVEMQWPGCGDRL